MWAPLTFCLLSALLTTGSALLCEVCMSKEESCSGPLQPCAAWEETCLIAVTKWNLGTQTINIMSKSCLETENCRNGQYTVTYSRNITLRSNVLCCDTDGCNTGTIPVPSVSPIPNGRQCPSCFNMGVDRCEDRETLACTGAEDHCIDYAGTLQIGDISSVQAAAGCCSPESTMVRAGLMKFTKYSFVLFTRVEYYTAARTGAH